MKLAHLFLAATISVGAAFASVAPATAMPAERPGGVDAGRCRSNP
ncbi:hypothetical protein ACVIRO_002311 [Rhizobium ruizarguesonis]